MSRVGTNNNITQPDARCMSCKRWKSAKLTVTDESADMACVETYGADKMAVVKKYEEREEKL